MIVLSSIRPLLVERVQLGRHRGLMLQYALRLSGTNKLKSKTSGVRKDANLDTVLFACVHNAGRSQMAAAWFNKICDRTKARAISAGTEPGERVHPEVVQVMREEGIDLTDAKPQFLSDQMARQATLLVTMGCGDACPFVPGLKKLDWPLPDPKGQPIEVVRKICDEIRRLVQDLGKELQCLRGR